MAKLHSTLLAYIGMGFVVLFWGFSWPAGKIVSTNWGSTVITAAFFRFSVALPILFIITKLLHYPLHVDRSLHKRIALLGFTQITLYNILYFNGLKYTASSDVSLLIATNPTITAVIAALVYKDEHLTSKRTVGLLIAFIGTFLIFLYSPNTDAPNRILGDFIIFVSAGTWALYTVFSRPVYQKVNPVVFQFWATVYGVLLLGILALFEQPWKYMTFNADAMYAIVYLGIFAAALANSLFSWGIKLIGPTRTSIFVNLVPVIGVFGSIMLIHEKFSIIYVLSFILIVIGVRLVQQKSSDDVL